MEVASSGPLVPLRAVAASSALTQRPCCKRSPMPKRCWPRSRKSWEGHYLRSKAGAPAPDLLDEAGARQLARKIEAYWHAHGHPEVSCWVELVGGA
jgi:hypothetical protein